MKKSTALLVTSACALTITSNSFGMLTKTSFPIKKIRSFCTKTNSYDHPLIFKRGELNIPTKNNSELLKQLVRERHQIKEHNTNLRKRITKQNKIIQQLDDIDDSIPIAKFLNGHKITALAQQLLQLEQEIRK